MFPYFNQDIKFRNAMSSRNANNLISVSKSNPFVTDRTLQAAQILASNNLKTQALDLAQLVVQKDNRSYGAWDLIYQLTNSSQPIHKIAGEKRHELNPRVKLS